MLNILILGGTQMLGRNFVEYLLKENKYNVYIANRGITNPDLFINKCSHIKINRNYQASCTALAQYTFDIVIDFSCYTPIQFQNTFQHIKYKKYIYISTVSVFDKDIFTNYNPNNAYHIYRVNKFNCELHIKNIANNNIILIRPCAVYGDFDYTNRFYKKNGKFYWRNNNLEAREGAMDVNDLTKFISKYIEIDTKNFLEINACSHNN
jgi:nucleoside-diphosphate-sugar epimerase